AVEEALLKIRIIGDLIGLLAQPESDRLAARRTRWNFRSLQNHKFFWHWMLRMFQAVYSGKICSFSRDLGRQRLVPFFTKCLDVIDLAGFLIAHFETSLVFWWAGIT